MKLFPHHIRLNGKTYRVKDFIQEEHSSAHEKALARFLKEWYAPGKFIKAKTSGSTGIPKTIKLDKEFAGQSAIRTLHFFNLKENQRILHCLPIHFIAGKLMAIRALAGNLDLYLTDPGTDFSFLSSETFRFAAMVPHQVHKLLAAEPSPGAWLSRIEQLLIGGSPVPYPLEKNLQQVSTACYSSYAMTETATHIALRKVNGADADSYYHCLDQISVELSPSGCLRIFMPDLPQQPLQTTDLAELKNEKTFRILGRSDNVIISGGIKYSPEHLEKKLEPFIQTPFLISALPHDSLGHALVLVTEGHVKNLPYLQETCRKQLDKYELPRQIISVAAIPETDSGKPDRKKMMAILKEKSHEITSQNKRKQ